MSDSRHGMVPPIFRYIYVLFIFTASTALIGQVEFNYDPVHPPNTFQSPQNPYYWKNKLPYEGYWQQDVHYSIEAAVSEESHILSATQKLTYWNNSPDTLSVVYFHLYQNAYQPGSYYEQKNVGPYDRTPNYATYESQGKGTEVSNLKQVFPDGAKELETHLDNTILKVVLDQPLAPGGYTIFDMEFKTYFDDSSLGRRMHWFDSGGFPVYKGVLWYPRIACYDKKFGWTIDQHLGTEFYGDFGTFDVELTFANDFVVDATGLLQNEAAVLPAELKSKLDIKNFADKPFGSAPSIITERVPGEEKTWKFHAENVHDFGFLAGPTLRIGESKYKNVTAISMAQEQHASKWQNAADFTKEIIKVFSEDIGLYGWNKIIVADARDGMEYPMITMDGGTDPGYRSLLAHEVGHMWFYGMVGSNETYRAFLDEGFTQFLTSWAMEKIDGKYVVQDSIKNKYRAKYTLDTETREDEVCRGYEAHAGQGYDSDLTTHSEHFDGYSYWNVYSKTASMLFGMQYLLGDDLFLECLQHYFNKWKFCHPYEEDMRQAFIEKSGVDLNWYFDQWLDTKHVVDYKLLKPKSVSGDKYLLSFERVGDMQMPLDVKVENNDGEFFDFIIPNTDFVKETDATILPKWYGWNDFNRSYETEIEVPGGIADITLDRRLADIYPIDNKLKNKRTFSFDHQIDNWSDRFHKETFWRPALWYNDYDGIKAGLHFNGNYQNILNRWDLTIFGNTRLANSADIPSELENRQDPISFLFNYSTRFNWHKNRRSRFHMQLKWLDGLYGGTIGAKHKWNRENSINFYLKAMMRDQFREDSYYLLHENSWFTGNWNNSFNVEWFHEYDHGNHLGEWTIGLRTNAPFSDYDYSALWIENIVEVELGKMPVRLRVFGQVGTGDNIPRESALYLSGANPEALMDNKYTRSSGIIPRDWGGFGADVNHFHHGGGLNLRGYAGYLAPENVDGEIQTFHFGQHGASASIEIDLDDLVNIRPAKLQKLLHLDVYLFGDAGLIYNGEDWSNLRMDAGAGTALTIKKFGPLDLVKPLVVRADFPLLLSHTPFLSPDYFQFRWILGLERSF